MYPCALAAVMQRTHVAGVVNVAKACLEAKVPRLVVVSSGGVATPDSSIYKFLNLFGEVHVFFCSPTQRKILSAASYPVVAERMACFCFVLPLIPKTPPKSAI